MPQGYNVRHPKRACPKGCLEELDRCTPKLVRLDNEDEGTPSRSKSIPHQLSMPFFLTGVTVLTSTSCCTSSHSISHEVSHMARVIIMITSRLHKTCKLCLQIFKCCDVIWNVMELSFMLLRCLWQLISSCSYIA